LDLPFYKKNHPWAEAIENKRLDIMTENFSYVIDLDVDDKDIFLRADSKLIFTMK
jgi:hypothetical protein